MVDETTSEQELPEIDPSTLDESQENQPASKPPEGEPIGLVAEDETGQAGPQKIQAFGHGLGTMTKSEYRRPVNITGSGATRCKVFHSKIAPGPMEFLEKTINDWVDEAGIEIKFVTKTVGVLEGKRAEPNLIVMIWY
jgi:hypothetical protein